MCVTLTVWFSGWQLESLLQLWLTLSLNSCSGGSEESGSDIFLFNASRVPTIPLNPGESRTRLGIFPPFSFHFPKHLVSYLLVLYLMEVYVSRQKVLSLSTLFWWLCPCSFHQQFPDGAGLVPQHLPEDLVSGAALPHPHDQHAPLW